MAEDKAGTDIIKVFKNGKVWVRRGIVTATIDPRQYGSARWSVEVKPPGRRKPGDGYRFYYGPFGAHGSKDDEAITEQDAVILAGKATTKDKVRMARKMLDWHFKEERERKKSA